NEAGKVIVWDVANEKTLATLDASQQMISSISILPGADAENVRLLLTDTGGNVARLPLVVGKWADAKPDATHKISDAAVWSAGVAGGKVIVGSADRNLYGIPESKWDSHTKIASGKDWITSVVLADSGGFAAEMRGTIHLLDAQGTPTGATLQAPSGVTAIAVADGGTVAVATRKTGIHLLRQQWSWSAAE
ncbi:MAG: hypothetical protein AAFN70_07865, partial [Planctomycetota bacterium]